VKKAKVSLTSWLEFTVENTANLTADEIIQLLSHSGTFDSSKFGTMLFLPDGTRVVRQIVNGIPGDRLLKLIGKDATSADSFMCILLNREYFVNDMDETPTEEVIRNSVRKECEPFSLDFPREKADKLITSVAQIMMETYVDENKRREFENNLRDVVDLIVSKFPPPNKENQTCWDNICKAIKIAIGESRNTDEEEKFAELEGRFPALKAAMGTRVKN
jgi:hypothetical protein